MLAPMVHWPEVMVAYEETEKILFSADAFGRFGALSRTAGAPWAPQARRYYYNIVGKYGAQVQALLKKASALEIKTVCPLHGPVLTGEALGEALRLYDLWSRWQSESPDDILLAHASIHGNTARAAELLKQKLEAKGARVTLCDLTTTEVSYAVANAFYCGKLVLACSTYDGGLFPPMEKFLSHLQAKPQRRPDGKRLVGACRGAADARKARGNEGPARVRHRGVAAQRVRPCKRSADGSAVRGAVREINI